MNMNSSEYVESMATYINSFTQYAYLASYTAGWWNDANDDNEYLIVPTKLALIHSEISEALEGYRKDQMDDHMPTRKAIEAELADAMIRIGDLAGRLGLDLGGAIMEKMAYNKTRADHKASARTALGGKKF